MRLLSAAVTLGCLVACGPAIPVWEGGATSPRAPHGAANPFWHQDGTRLVDGEGRPVVMRGVNLGGWLLWEGWMFGGGFSNDGESKLVARLAEVVGEGGAEQFRDRVHREFIGEADLARIAALGFNSVRVPFNSNLLERDEAPFVYREDGFAVLDRVLDWCDAHGLKAVLDLHSAPGGQSGFFMADPRGTSLWKSPQAQARTVALWRVIAERYRGRAAVAGYDLINEPDPPSGRELFELLRRIAAAIREVDDQHLLILEGSSGDSNLSMFTGPVSHDVVYSVHQYEFFGDWRRDELTRWHALSQAHQVPLWVGEFGLDGPRMMASTVALYDDPEVGTSGYAFWSWKEVNDNPDFFVRPKAPLKAWRSLAGWMNSGWGARPTPSEVWRGLDEFLAASRLGECEVNEAMAAALVPR